MDEQPIQTFITRWSKSGGAERANYQLFLSELCDVLDVPRPEPTVQDDSQNSYVFERNVEFDNRDGTRSTKRIDLYKRGCFVLESKQGVQQQDDSLVLSAKQQALRAKRKRGHGMRGTAGWDDAMFRARGQAEQYVRALPAAEGRPPLILVVDVRAFDRAVRGVLANRRCLRAVSRSQVPPQSSQLRATMPFALAS